MAKNFITNIVGGCSKSDLAKIGNAESVNMYVETTNSDQEYVSRIVRSIPGMETVIGMSGIPRGMFTVSRGPSEQPTLYAVFGSKLYMVQDGKSYEIGVMTDSSNICHFCETGGYGDAHPHLVIVDGFNVYKVNTGLSVPEQMNDFNTVEIPLRQNSSGIYISPTHCAYMYGHLIINDAGTDTFFYSHQYPFETTTEEGTIDYNIFDVKDGHSLNYAYSEWQPDKTLALCSNGSRLYTFGDRSYQVFQYNDSVNRPFTSPDTAAKMIGIKATNSLAQLGEYTLWLGSADIGNNGVYLNTGSVDSKRISTTEIERQIAKMKRPTDAEAQIWQENQHIFYALTFPSDDVTLVYDIKEDIWHVRGSLDKHNELREWRYSFATMGPNGDVLWATTDAIVQETENSWKDHDGTPMLRKRTGGVIYSGYSKFYIDSLNIEMNNGQYYESEGKDIKLGMRYTADGSEWSDMEVVSVGNAGDYDYDCEFYNFGLAKTFSIELSTTSDFPFALYGIRMNTQPVKW